MLNRYTRKYFPVCVLFAWLVLAENFGTILQAKNSVKILPHFSSYTHAHELVRDPVPKWLWVLQELPAQIWS